jgi:hypothetical protein
MRSTTTRRSSSRSSRRRRGSSERRWGLALPSGHSRGCAQLGWARTNLRETSGGQVIPGDDLSELAALSMRARLAIALHLFAGYCGRRRLNHPDVESFVEHLWRFMGLKGGEDFERWEFGRPPLIDAGMGWEYPPGFEAFLAARGIPQAEFRRVLECTTELLYGSMYGAADNAGSLQYLEELAGVGALVGVVWPDLAAFAGSGWVGDGWGQPLSPEQLSRWRAAGGA